MSCVIKDKHLQEKCSNKNTYCYKNKCHSTSTKLSSSMNRYGIVYILDNNHVIKISKEHENENELIKEIQIQKYTSKYKLAPKIYQYYFEHENDKEYTSVLKNENKNKKMYIVMENLLTKGYRTLYELYEKTNKTIPDECIEIIIKNIKKLHGIGVSHRDLHSMNILYNENTKKIKFIDFGLSIKTDSINSAIVLEKWSQVMKLPRDIKGSWKKYDFYYNKFGDSSFKLCHLMFCELYNNNTNNINTYLNSLQNVLVNKPKVVESIHKLIKMKKIYNKASSKKREHLKKVYEKEIAIIKNKNFDPRNYIKLILYQTD